MPEPLPPELSRLGDELALATNRSAAAERRRAVRRRRLAVTAVATLIAFVALGPARLQPGGGTVQLAAATAVPYTPSGCDRPRGATFAAASPCASPGATGVAPGKLARRLAEN